MAPRQLSPHTRRLLSGPRNAQKLREAAMIERIIERSDQLTDEMVQAILTLDQEESPESVVNSIAALVVFTDLTGFADLVVSKIGD